MVPDKFNMVDMGGIDLIMMQGEAVPGLYEKLMAAISNCQYQCLYNWMFDSVLIPPTYVQMTVVDGEIYINGGVSVTSDDVIHIYTISPGPTPPAIIPLLAEENSTYNAPAGVDGFNPVTVDVPSYTPVISPITITENGIYNAPSGVDGFGPVTVNVPAAGVPLFTAAEWSALSSQQKRSYGLVAIQDAVAGYIRGNLVNGADFVGEIVQSGTGSSSISDNINTSGSFILVVLALNSEASTFQLNIDAKINGSSLTGETVSFNSYSGSGTNRRNYRLNKYPVTVGLGDTINIEVTNRSSFSSFVWALIDITTLTLDKAISTADAPASGTNSNSGFILMGTFAGSSGGTIELVEYTANETVTTENPGTNYKSAYIFWFT